MIWLIVIGFGCIVCAVCAGVHHIRETLEADYRDKYEDAIKDLNEETARLARRDECCGHQKWCRDDGGTRNVTPREIRIARHLLEKTRAKLSEPERNLLDFYERQASTSKQGLKLEEICFDDYKDIPATSSAKPAGIA